MKTRYYLLHLKILHLRVKFFIFIRYVKGEKLKILHSIDLSADIICHINIDLKK